MSIWIVPRFEVPNTELGFAGELGFVGTVRLSPAPVDWLVPELTELGFPGDARQLACNIALGKIRELI